MDRDSSTGGQRPGSESTGAASPEEIPDFLVRAAASEPQHASGAEDVDAEGASPTAAPEAAPEVTDAGAPDAVADTPAQDDEFLGGAYARQQAEQQRRPQPLDPATYDAYQAELRAGQQASQAGQAGQGPAGTAGTSGRTPYVRQRTPHKTQPAIDDDALEGSFSSDMYAHDSNVTIGGGVLNGGRSYRRARSSRQSMQQGRYGRYLEVPKGRRSIFASRERARRRRSLIVTIVVIAVFVVIAVVIAQLATSLG